MNFVDDPESAVLAAAKDMLRRGLVEGTAGNISARRSDGNVVITPSSVDYAEMLLHDLVLVDAGGAVLHAKDGRSPSTELNLHLACYRAFDDIGSVIHSHPVWATMFAVAHEPIPACIDEFAKPSCPPPAVSRRGPSEERCIARRLPSEICRCSYRVGC